MAWVKKVKRRFGDSVSTPVVQHDKLHRDLYERFQNLPKTWDELTEKEAQCIFQGSTQVNEMLENITEFQADFTQYIEKMFREKAVKGQVDALELVRPYWEEDLTGAQDLPQVSELYTSSKKPRPACFTLQAIQNETYFHFRAHLLRLFGTRIQNKLKYKITVWEQEQEHKLTTKTRGARKTRIKWNKIVTELKLLCVPDTGGF